MRKGWIEGIVVKKGKVRPKIVEAVFKCPSCNHLSVIPQSGWKLIEPSQCSGKNGGCGSKITHPELLLDKSKFIDSCLLLVLTQKVFDANVESLPSPSDYLIIEVLDDKVDDFERDRRYVFEGILRKRYKRGKKGNANFYKYYLECENGREIRIN